MNAQVSTGPPKISERKIKLQLKRVQVPVNASYINHGLKKNVNNIQMKGGKLKCSDYMTKAKLLYLI